MLDLRTLMLSLIVMIAIQGILLMVMAMTIKAYRGIHLWGLGCIMIAFYLFFLYLRRDDAWGNILTFTSYSSCLLALLLFYFGTKNLLHLPFKFFLPLILSVVYIGFMAIFTFIWDQLFIRTLLFSFMMAFITIKIGIMLTTHHKKSFRSSAILLTSIFLILGLFFLFWAIKICIIPPKNDLFFQTNKMQAVFFFVSLTLCFVWCLGVILLVNQKLNGELKDRTEELESSNEDKNKLFSILAHDLRGPVATIESIIDLLTDVESGINEKQHSALMLSMKKTVHSTNILLDNLLDWASMQSGLRTIQPVETTYGKMMVPVMPVLYAQANHKNIVIMEQIPSETLLRADTKMAQSVFRNLVSNAIKFTPTNGTIVIKTNTSDNGLLIFSISDNGIGIDEDLMNHLFDIDSKCRRLGTNGETSTGLGLMICKEFVEKHGGRIWVESEVGKGSTFSFSLEPTT